MRLNISPSVYMRVVLPVIFRQLHWQTPRPPWGRYSLELTTDFWENIQQKADTVILWMKCSKSWLLMGILCRFLADKSFTGRMHSL